MNQKDPHHEPDELDEPTPPGSPMRRDAPSGSETPGTPAPDPGPGPVPAGGEMPETEGDRPVQEPHERDLQEENAASSLDQPSQ